MLHAEHLLKPNSKKIGLFVVWDIFNPSLKFLNSYEANYFTKKELNEIIIKKCFKDITSDINKNLYNIRGPTRYYYSIFVKI